MALYGSNFLRRSPLDDRAFQPFELLTALLVRQRPYETRSVEIDDPGSKAIVLLSDHEIAQMEIGMKQAKSMHVRNRLPDRSGSLPDRRLLG